MQLSGADIRLLRVFEVVVRNKGFAAAQAELNVSLSTISSQISALEIRLGFRLCERGRGGFRLTERGAEAAESVKALLSTFDTFTDQIADLQGDLRGKLRIGVVDCVASDPCLKFGMAISNFRTRAPAVRLSLLQGSPQDFQSRILNGDLDIALGSFPNKPGGIEAISLYIEQNSLYCGEGHPLFGKATAPGDDIYKYAVASRSYWHQSHENNIRFRNVQAEAQSIEQQLLLVQSGEYIGFLPDHAAHHLVAARKLQAIMPSVFRYHCEFELIVRTGAKRSDKILSFITALQDAHRSPGRAIEPVQRSTDATVVPIPYGYARRKGQLSTRA